MATSSTSQAAVLAGTSTDKKRNPLNMLSRLMGKGETEERNPRQEFALHDNFSQAEVAIKSLTMADAPTVTGEIRQPGRSGNIMQRMVQSVRTEFSKPLFQVRPEYIAQRAAEKAAREEVAARRPYLQRMKRLEKALKPALKKIDAENAAEAEALRRQQRQEYKNTYGALERQVAENRIRLAEEKIATEYAAQRPASATYNLSHMEWKELKALADQDRTAFVNRARIALPDELGNPGATHTVKRNGFGNPFAPRQPEATIKVLPFGHVELTVPLNPKLKPSEQLFPKMITTAKYKAGQRMGQAEELLAAEFTKVDAENAAAVANAPLLQEQRYQETYGALERRVAANRYRIAADKAAKEIAQKAALLRQQEHARLNGVMEKVWPEVEQDKRIVAVWDQAHADNRAYDAYVLAWNQAHTENRRRVAAQARRQRMEATVHDAGEMLEGAITRARQGVTSVAQSIVQIVKPVPAAQSELTETMRVIKPAKGLFAGPLRKATASALLMITAVVPAFLVKSGSRNVARVAEKAVTSDIGALTEHVVTGDARVFATESARLEMPKPGAARSEVPKVHLKAKHHHAPAITPLVDPGLQETARVTQPGRDISLDPLGTAINAPQNDRLLIPFDPATMTLAENSMPPLPEEIKAIEQTNPAPASSVPIVEQAPPLNDAPVASSISNEPASSTVQTAQVHENPESHHHTGKSHASPEQKPQRRTDTIEMANSDIAAANSVLATHASGPLQLDAPESGVSANTVNRESAAAPTPVKTAEGQVASERDDRTEAVTSSSFTQQEDTRESARQRSRSAATGIGIGTGTATVIAMTNPTTQGTVAKMDKQKKRGFFHSIAHIAENVGHAIGGS